MEPELNPPQATGIVLILRIATSLGTARKGEEALASYLQTVRGGAAAKRRHVARRRWVKQTIPEHEAAGMAARSL